MQSHEYFRTAYETKRNSIDVFFQLFTGLLNGTTTFAKSPKNDKGIVQLLVPSQWAQRGQTLQALHGFFFSRTFGRSDSLKSGKHDDSRAPNCFYGTCGQLILHHDHICWWKHDFCVHCVFGILLYFRAAAEWSRLDNTFHEALAPVLGHRLTISQTSPRF